MRAALLGILLLAGGVRAAVLDRIAVVVGQRVVKLSDIDRDARVTEFLNRDPLALNATTRRAAAERLVNQQLIREELASGGYARATDEEASSMMGEIRRSRFAGSEPRFRQELASYGLTEEQLRSHLLWQLTVLRFIDERFRPGVLATDEEIRAYYDQHPELRRTSFEAAAPEIRRSIEGQRVNEQFEAWLKEERQRVPASYREGAFQ